MKQFFLDTTRPGEPPIVEHYTLFAKSAMDAITLLRFYLLGKNIHAEVTAVAARATRGRQYVELFL